MRQNSERRGQSGTVVGVVLSLVLLQGWGMGCVSEPPEPSPTLPPVATPTVPPGEPTATQEPETDTPLSQTTPPDQTPSPDQTTAPVMTPTVTESPAPTATPSLPTPTPAQDNDDDGFTLEEGDCNDGDATTYPGATELPYDGVDQNCDGDDLTDVDGDGFDGQQVDGPDCDDSSQATYPDATEIGDGKDNDCDGMVDEDVDSVDNDGDGLSDLEGDCNDADDQIHPGATELPYNGVDEDCSGLDLTDVDQDGYEGGSSGSDCNDGAGDIHPTATELPYDGIDQDCSGSDLTDVDGDGSNGGSSGADCNDTAASIHPGASEVPYDGIDQDCSGSDLTDVDGDGSNGGSGGADCNDDAASVHPGATDIPYDGIDQDCSGADLTDVDGDGSNGGPNGPDCNDASTPIHPGATEIPYDGIDQDCSGSDLVDVDGDGSNSTAVGGKDCDDTNPFISPSATEVCDEIDNNCDGIVDTNAVDRKTWYTDSDHDGYGNLNAPVLACKSTSDLVGDSSDCDDSRADVHPGASETCDGVDNDCDTQIDEGVKITYYQDNDKDGYGNAAVTTQACALPTGYATVSGDCNDNNANIKPTATEVANGLDDNCNGSIDEGVYFTSCATLLASLPTSASGTYTVDPDGGGAIAPFQVYCDMTRDGGGWTLVAKVNIADTTLSEPRSWFNQQLRTSDMLTPTFTRNAGLASQGASRFISTVTSSTLAKFELVAEDDANQRAYWYKQVASSNSFVNWFQTDPTASKTCTNLGMTTNCSTAIVGKSGDVTALGGMNLAQYGYPGGGDIHLRLDDDGSSYFTAVCSYTFNNSGNAWHDDAFDGHWGNGLLVWIR